MIKTVTIVESCTYAGSEDRINEDAFGYNSDCAFVIDGATGLGEHQFINANGSDAAWLASTAADHFTNTVVRTNQIQPIVGEFISSMREAFFNATRDHKVPRYAWPSASFAMLHISVDAVWFAGLGDCTLHIEAGAGVKSINPLGRFEGIESNNAARHIQRSGGFEHQKNLLKDPTTLENLRAIRSLQNTNQSGIWTLGLEPIAAQHMWTERLKVSNNSTALLCSDGFSALVTDYKLYSAETLLEAAQSKGLATLMDELREVEKVIDPGGKKYPRFKQSDDATAMLLNLSS